MSAKNTVLMYAEQDGWRVESDFVESVDLSRSRDGVKMTIFIQFTRSGQVSSAICHRPHFSIKHQDSDKLQLLLGWLRNGWRKPNVPVYDPTPEQVTTSAERERVVMREQAYRNYVSRVADAARRLQEELDHYDSVYEQRLAGAVEHRYVCRLQGHRFPSGPPWSQKQATTEACANKCGTTRHKDADGTLTYTRPTEKSTS